ncbi:flavodoxin domain-containing protein [Streptomyces meridianus]|uniref:Flavodoxin domain-containing protein n=1 Tax=Streptomyces meridianus TaxID=2938945 RepID=A0ABT0X4G5_9ACTN|nr:flavodoxin domain-containing protein [Streptomyces meridianus]MCM2577422.1 flavodoxin domain-containing protein [Streptomyces meridianus]
MVVLVGYASAHGSTRGIATRIATRLREQGFEVDARPVDEAGPAGSYEAMVIGSAVHNGDWLDEAAAFLEDNARVLADRPVWLFSVGLARALGGRFEAKAKPPRRVAAFRRTATASEHHLFAGRVERDHLPLPGRLLWEVFGGRYGDFRDWDEIDAWAAGIGRALGRSDGGSAGPG